MSPVSTLPLPEALMWFIENYAALPPDVEAADFMLLRERYRKEYQGELQPGVA